MSNKIPPVNHNIAEPWWGLKRDITPCFGARLVQEGNRLHYLADRASITGQFSDADLRHLDQAFPLMMKQLEQMLGHKTMEAEILRDALEIAQAKKLISRMPLLPPDDIPSSE